MAAGSKISVLKRNGKEQEVDLVKFTSSITKLCYNLDTNYVNSAAVAQRVIDNLISGISVAELSNLAAEVAATMTTKHPDYAILAARIAVANLHKETKQDFSDVMADLHNCVDEITGQQKPLISHEHMDVILAYKNTLNCAIHHRADFEYDYFGFKTLEKNYLLRIGDKVVERPQHMLMRVAVAIHMGKIDRVIETYYRMSQGYFSHASPTIFSACSPRQQMSSCFVLTMTEDSMIGIYDTLKRCALITKAGGGIGLSLQTIRSKGTCIAGTKGESSGLTPMIRVFDNTARYVDQGNKRPGAYTLYLEPWHADIFEFLDLKKNAGKEEYRARELFYALWIPDLFMRRVMDDGKWSLMCPHESPGLVDVWGEEFDKLYEEYEEKKRFKQQVNARDLWKTILISQVETGAPYMLYKDNCNRKSNQQNVGTIRSGNLNPGIVEYCDPYEVAVGNLALIVVNSFVDTKRREFDFFKLKEIVKVVTRNLNRIIDVNHYPIPETRTSNLRHRPIGIGIEGLADAFILMRYPFESEAAQKLNIQIFETLYYGALEASCELAAEEGPYPAYDGCPISRGILQHDMWNVMPSDLWDWGALKEKVSRHGIRNSLLIALMPTASTAEIFGHNESVEPYTSNVCTKNVSKNDIRVVNAHLLRDLIERSLWDDDMKNEIVSNDGSIQGVSRIPEDLKELYKTVWEIPQKTILKMAADRGAFIDQSQSLNIYMAQPTQEKLTSMHFYGWKAGLKSGMYNLRTKAAVNPLQFKIDELKLEVAGKTEVKTEKTVKTVDEEEAIMACSRENGDACVMCSG